VETSRDYFLVDNYIFDRIANDVVARMPVGKRASTDSRSRGQTARGESEWPRDRRIAPSTGQVVLPGLSGAVAPWATAPFILGPAAGAACS